VLAFFDGSLYNNHMSKFEAHHPLAADVALIQEAFGRGLGYELTLPDHLEVVYDDDPLQDRGIKALQISDATTENEVGIYSPTDPSRPDDSWYLFGDEGVFTVAQRIIVRDKLDRMFPISFDDNQVTSPYLRFDVLHEGVVLSAEQDGEVSLAVGLYDGETYATLNTLARHQACVQTLLKFASDYC
jgi:hypothetical protein